MRDTYFYIPESKKKRLVPIQTNFDGFWKIYDAEKYDVDYPLKGKDFFSGGAGLSSTVTSFSKFLQMICDGGVYKNKRIVSSNIIESLKENLSRVKAIPKDIKIEATTMSITKNGRNNKNPI